MKKILVVLAAVMVCISMCACGNSDEVLNSGSESSMESVGGNDIEETNEKPDEDKNVEDKTEEDKNTEAESEVKGDTEDKEPIQTELSNEGLFDGEILLNGAVIKLPITFKKLTQMGYEPESMTLEPGMGYSLRCTHSETGLFFFIKAINNSDKALKTVDNCKSEEIVVYEFDFGVLDNSDIEYTLELANGVKIGETNIDEIAALYGEPTESKKVSRYYYYEYIYQSEDGRMVDFYYSKEEDKTTGRVVANVGEEAAKSLVK